MSFESVSEQFLVLLGVASVKGGLALLLVGMLAFVMRRSSASVRHLLWLLGLCGLLLLPALALVLPVWPVPFVPAWTKSELPVDSPNDGDVIARIARLFPKSEPPDELALPLIANAKSPKSAHGQPQLPLENTESAQTGFADWFSAISVWRWMFLIWMAGVLVAIVRLILGTISLARLRITNNSITEGRLWSALEDLRIDCGMRRRVLLIITNERVIPMTWGLFRPVILLPKLANEWKTDQLRMILQHELAHVRRFDYLTQCLACLVRAVFWFHPLVWWALRRLRLEQERACDDIVLQAGSRPADYAELLLAVSLGKRPGAFVTPPALGAGSAQRLQKRLLVLLDTKQRRYPMNKRLLCMAAVVALSLAVPLAALRGDSARVPETQKATARHYAAQSSADPTIEQVRRILEEKYVNPLDKKRIAQGAIEGMLKQLKDPYSTYYTPEQIAELKTRIHGFLVGVGAQIKIADNHLQVVTPIAGSPALKAGVRAGDAILTIDGKSTNNLPLADCVKLLRGPKGTVVTVEVRRAGGQRAKLKITRDRIRLSAVEGIFRQKNHKWNFMLDAQKTVAYLRITSFNADSAMDAAATLRDLKKKGMKGLILDLRNCPGGLMAEAVKIGDLFLSDGIIVTIKRKGDKSSSFVAKKDSLGKLPMVVLINGSSASAAEILAGALKDHDRAKLLGTRTFGKGSVQSLIALKGDGGALRLTTAYHYLPSGRNIQKHPGAKVWGVDPHNGYYFPITDAQEQTRLKGIQQRRILSTNGRFTAPDNTADPQLSAALTSISAKLSTGAFKKVGKALEEQDQRFEKLRQLRARRELLQRDLQRLNRELNELNQQFGNKK